MKPEIIEVNSTELCNRKCSFCPRGSGYPNLNQNLSLDNAKILFDKLIEFDYNGNFHITGSGEPTLNPNFVEIVKLFYQNKNLKLKMTTNGDYIGKKDFSYFEYFDEIRISIYDGEERYEQVKKLTTNYNVDVRKQYINQEMFNNCGGWFESSELIDKTCYIPFYRLQIDWNLDIRLCCHDWKEKIVLGNLRYDSLENIWLDYFSAIREQLIKYNRKKLNPCKNCNVNGIQNIYTKKPDGLEHFNFFKEYYESKNNRQSNWNEIA